MTPHKSETDFLDMLQRKLSGGLRRARGREWLRNVLSKLQNNARLRRNILQAIPFWIASFIVGLLAVGYAQLFGIMEDLSIRLLAWADWSIFVALPLCMVGGWWLVHRFAPFARGSGIPQVLAAIELSDGPDDAKVPKLLSVRIILVKMASSLLMVLGGAAIGREGPTIQIAASVFRKINDMLPAWWPKLSRGNMIVTGAAAGLAAAFNTPLGGIVFAVEELSKAHFSRFRTAVFTAVIIAGLTAQGLLGPYLYLGYPKIGDYSWGAFFGVILVAAVAGALGGGTSKLILLIFAWKARFRTTLQHIAYLLVCSLALASSIYWISDLAMGSGKEIMAQALFGEEKEIDWYLPLLRMGGPLLSFTSGAGGGIFAPALSAGASIGGVIAGLFSLNGPNTNLLVLGGMVAFLTGITRSPFTSAILVLEMTDRHTLIFHLMAAGVVANIAAYPIDRRSLYERLKERFLRDLDVQAQARENVERGNEG